MHAIRAKDSSLISNFQAKNMCPLSYRMGGVLCSLSTFSQGVGVGVGYRANELKLKRFVRISPQLTALASMLPSFQLKQKQNI